MSRRIFVTAVLLGVLAFAPRTASASLLLGGQLFVQEDGDVIAKFLGELALFDSELFLFSPGPTGTIFTNSTSSPGDTVNLGFFSAGTELTFGLLVHNSEIPADMTFFTGPGGPGSLNPDLIAHALVSDDPFNDITSPPFPAGALAFLVLQGLLAGETVVGFEDRHALDPLNDFDYNDHIFSFTNVGLERPSVPEPATLLLLGGGVAGFIARRRRANKRSL